MCVPTTAAAPPGTRETVVPETMTGLPPALKVDPANTMFEEASAVYADSPKVSTAAEGRVARSCVLVPTTAARPPGAMEIGVLSTVAAGEPGSRV